MNDRVRMFNSEVLQGTNDLQIWKTVANLLNIRDLYLIWIKFSKSTGFEYAESNCVQYNFYKVLKFNIKEH